MNKTWETASLFPFLSFLFKNVTRSDINITHRGGTRMPLKDGKQKKEANCRFQVQ